MNRQFSARARSLYLLFVRNASFMPQESRRIDIGSLALLSVPIATFCLGTWQVQRRSWKLNLIEEVKKQNRAPPIDLPDNLEVLSDMEYRRVHVRGKFDHSKELYIGPRPLLTDKDEGGGIISTRPQTGSLVITPFHISDRNITILVNRGWVPNNKIDPAKRSEGQIKDEIDLVGTIRLEEKRPQFSPKNIAGSTQFYYRDIPRMARLCKAMPVYIDADADSTVSGGPIGGQTRITFRNEHLSYVVTWYSLCAATSYMWYKKYFQRIKLL